MCVATITLKWQQVFLKFEMARKWSSTHHHRRRCRRNHHHHHLLLQRVRLVPSEKCCSKTSPLLVRQGQWQWRSTREGRARKGYLQSAEPRLGLPHQQGASNVQRALGATMKKPLMKKPWRAWGGGKFGAGHGCDDDASAADRWRSVLRGAQHFLRHILRYVLRNVLRQVLHVRPSRVT